MEERKEARLQRGARKEEKALSAVKEVKDDIKRDKREARRLSKALAATGDAKDAKSVYKSVNEQGSLKAKLAKAHVLALRLYTCTPVSFALNGPLRTFKLNQDSSQPLKPVRCNNKM